MINKNTEIFGSFSIKAGNNGCTVFNKCFEYYKLNAIYKSFSVTSIKDAVQAARTLNFKGFAVSMPFKTEILQYVDEIDDICQQIGACNTVINKNGILKAYNTDYLALKELFSEDSIKYNLIENCIIILGNGGFSKAAQFACKELNIKYHLITRDNWSEIGLYVNNIILNCTPAEISFHPYHTNLFIDGRPNTKTGKKIALMQAKYQFEPYTNLKYPNYES